VIISLRPHQKRALSAMQSNNRGQVIVPTGGGKTICMIQDAKQQLQSNTSKTIVVVAPRILLANQLCSEFLELITQKNVNVLHVHSGETKHVSTTKVHAIQCHHGICKAVDACEHELIFTTYHSLHKLQEAGVKVDTIYFDEAHNSVQRNFFAPTEHFSGMDSIRCFFFTATPKHSLTITKPGMNDPEVYGQVICNISAPELVEQGYILPPKVVVQELPTGDQKQSDHKNLIQTIDNNALNKILVCARSTTQIVKLVSQSDFCIDLVDRGYSWMYITSKTGAVIDGKKVSREVFFKTLNEWGKNPYKRFVVLHHSILSEGINVNGLECVVFMRNMDYIGISQTIGRVIRLGDKCKTYGLVCIPTYDKVGISTSRKVQAVVDTVFEKGEPAISEVRK